MNSKAIKRQLLAAIAMVLVAAIALGSSTYAWFVASGTVTAEGMSVTAQGESGLLIRYNGGKWGSTASAVENPPKIAQLFPASTSDLVKWSHATALAAGNTKADNETFTDVSNAVFSGSDHAYADNSFVFMREFEIQSSSSSVDTKGLRVSGITVTDSESRTAQKTMSTALRVGIKYTKSGDAAPGAGENGAKTSELFIFAPVTLGSEDTNSPSTSYKIQQATYNDSTQKYDLVEKDVTAIDEIGNEASDPKYYLIGTNETIPSDGSGVKVQIFIWFEGEDRNLFTNNFNVETLNISVNFSCATQAGATQTA